MMKNYTKTCIYGSVLHPKDYFNMFLPFLLWIWFYLVLPTCKSPSASAGIFPKGLGYCVEYPSWNGFNKLTRKSMVVNKVGQGKQRKCYGSWPCAGSGVNYCLPKSWQKMKNWLKRCNAQCMHVSVHTRRIHHFEILTLGHSKKPHGTCALLLVLQPSVLTSAHISPHQLTFKIYRYLQHPTSKYLQSGELTQLRIVGNFTYNCIAV